MNDEEILIAHNIFINKGAFAVLLGAGVSRSAGIPSGWEILIDLINRLSILKQQKIADDPELWYREEFKTEAGYSKVIEQLTNTREERLNLLKPFFEVASDDEKDSKKPTIAHLAIADLVKRSYIKVVITTNFDRLMESALREVGIEPTVISNPSQIDNVMPIIHSRITVIKVNGDYLDTKFLNIEAELSAYDEKLVALLTYVFENFGLITSGWSGVWDIGLREILKSSNKFRFSNFFSYVGGYGDELKSLSSSRGGKLIIVKDADSFFKEIAENVQALEKSQNNHPLSKQLAIERLKKYLRSEESRIDLYELLDREVQKVFGILNERTFPYPDEKTVREVIEGDLKSLELLLSLLIEGVYWGDLKQHNIWVKALTKIAHPRRQSTSYAIWNSLMYFPALVLIYSVGLTALSKKDYSLIKNLFEIELFSLYREGEKINIVKEVNSYIVETDILKKILGVNQYVPMSEFLYKIIKPTLIKWLADEKEFDELFDEFEVLYRLQFIAKANKHGALPGRYIYRRGNPNNFLIKKIEEINAKKENVDWVKEGLFKDFNSLKENYDLLNKNLEKYSL